MKTYLENENGDLTRDGEGIPKSHPFYTLVLAEVEAGEAEILPYAEPEKTSDQLIAELEVSVTPRNLRGAALGDDYALKKIKEVDDAIAKLRG